MRTAVTGASGIRNLAAGAVIGAVSLLSVAAPATAETFSGLMKAEPQPSAEMLKPGLAVRYYGAKFQSIKKLLEWMEYEKGVEGEPIPMLNYQVGEGPVLTTTATDLMGADITGFIHFKEAGSYMILVHSNDGVQVTIGGKMIHEDPEVHGDRFSDEITLEISEPGWYPVRVLYFEKKGTSTLELYWDPPGPAEADLVPAEAFAHIGN